MNRVCLVLSVIFCAFAISAVAQENVTGFVVTAAAPVEEIRFAGAPSSVQLRIEVRSASGALIYDSDWKDGSILDWLPQDGSGQPLANGAYRLVMQSKNLAGQTSHQEAALHVDSGGMAIDSQPGATPRITLTAHDGETGQLITTSGDLSFRFGDFLNRKDIEAMRLTAAGDLNVSGLIRAKGIVLPDGTILTTATGITTGGDGGSATRQRPSAPGTPNTANMSNRETEVRQRVLLLNPPAAPAPRLVPRPNFAPAFQFVVGDTGVSVGTTNPAYNLTVNGTINTNTSYQVNGATILSGDASNTFAGELAANHNSGSNANSFFGNAAGYSNTTGIRNSFFGADAGGAVTTACCISMMGYLAGGATNTGASNAFFGYYSGGGNTSGGYNAFFGDESGLTLTTENYNTGIGYKADITAGVQDATAVGWKAQAAQNNTVILGSINGVNGAIVTASTGIGTNSPNQYLAVGGGITVDYNNTNNGTTTSSSNNTLTFGSGATNAVSGEAIASQRGASGGNQYGLDFYTLYLKRMTIANNGDVSVVGNLSKATGSFKIDHPLDPENKYLYHSFVESPDMMNIYNGNVTLDALGEAVVQLPDWFEALNQDFRYQLTCLHGFAPVYIDEEIAGSQFKIAGGKPGMKVSWQVTGIRHDPYANAHRILVEEEKPAAERGKYLHPTEYGQPKERGSNN